jgi:serine protease Do
MLQDIYARYRGACMMLLRQEGDSVIFMGTTFLVHPEGYLLTAGHLLGDHTEVMVAPRDYGAEFAPPWSETVVPFGASVVAVDKEHDVALLRFKIKHEISMPDHVIGVPEDVMPGSNVACLGYPFGFCQVYNQVIEGGIVTAKVLSTNETELFLFDAPVNNGLRGGPLVNLYDGRVIGIAGGPFIPEDAVGLEQDDTSQTRRVFSYAMSINYGARLLEAEGAGVV